MNCHDRQSLRSGAYARPIQRLRFGLLSAGAPKNLANIVVLG